MYFFKLILTFVNKLFFHKKYFNILVRISSIIFIFAGVLNFNTLYLQPIGSGINISNEFFQVNTIIEVIDAFLLKKLFLSSIEVKL